MSDHWRDVALTCVDCNTPFTWTAKDQEFYEEKGYTQPKRCPDCRKAKRARMAAEGR